MFGEPAPSTYQTLTGSPDKQFSASIAFLGAVHVAKAERTTLAWTKAQSRTLLNTNRSRLEVLAAWGRENFQSATVRIQKSSTLCLRPRKRSSFRLGDVHGSQKRDRSGELLVRRSRKCLVRRRRRLAAHSSVRHGH